MMRLWSFERRWFSAMLAAIFPSGASESFPHGAEDVPLDRFLDDFERFAPFKVRLGIRLSLWIIALAPLFMSGLRSRFMKLDAEQREASLTRLSGSNVYILRELPVLLKTIGAMAVLGVPDAQRAIGIGEEQIDDEPPNWVGAPARLTVTTAAEPSPVSQAVS